ncbi:MAG TPA: amino acid adenylation domain-containing protein, partial [Thermoanaerobaculia bacterium]|nr:amino acid adenylation domain-containing protein [Thermoanaerobaculia bacterium]
VFQVVLALQNLPPSELDLEGLTLSTLEIGTGRTQFDLSLFLVPMPGLGGLQARLHFASDLFEKATARRLLGHFRRLLEGAAEDLRVSDLPLLDEAEREQVLTAWNRTEAGIPDEPVHRLVFQWAERMPEAPAVAWDGGSLTYGDLAVRARDLAERLRACGVGPETVVALQLDRSADLLVSALAVLEAGGAYLPIDPSWPEERQRWILEDSRAVLLSGLGGGALSREAGEGRGGGLPQSLAYVIYTSGSTGRPKGTELCHRGLSSFIAWHRETYDLRPGDRTTLVASPGFDASVWETWAPLTAGAEVHIPPRDVMLSPAALLAWMAERGITLSFLPTPLAEAVLAEELPEGLRLRALLTGGDRLRRRPAAGLPFELINHYGPTESTVVATAGRVSPAGERAPDIGLPIANTRVYLLDRHLQPVPFGVAGELCLAGEGLARGYRNRPELTAERFVPDPFGDGGRLYRTGDLARRLASGEIEFLGRIDHQVKIRGNRIELGEIEAALSRQPGVESAVVLACEDRLVAYVVGGDSGLRQALRRELPEAMVPSAFVFLDTLPLTPNGKVDRKALPAPDLERREAVAAERSPVEELLAGIWAELLGVSPIASGESFFELGGHSLLATRMLSRVRAVLGVEIPLRAVFEEPTLAGFAARVESERQAGAPAVPPLVPVPRNGPLPASFSQRRLWFLSRLDPGSAAYNLAGGVRLEGDLNVAALAGALGAIVRRHESLRTVFMNEGGEPWQVVLEPAPLPLPVIDLGALPEARREEELRRIAAGEASRPYDLARGPLVRSALLRLDGRRHALLVGMHHIVSDGWSLSLFVRELGELYRGQSLPGLPIQYADYAAWQRSWLSDEVMEERLAWWKRQLAGAPPLVDLPLDHPRASIQSTRGDQVALAIEPELTARFESLARRLGVTPFMALLAGFAALPARYGDQDDVVVGTPIANRGRAELEDLIGFFVSTLALRVDLSGDPGFGELAHRVREMSLGAYAHQDVPFERLVDELRPDRSLSHSPVFQVVLALQNLPSSELDLEGLTLSRLEIGTAHTQFDLSLFLVPVPGLGGLQARLHFASDLFEKATARRLLGHFRRLLEGAAEDLRVSDLPLLDETEREQVLTAWNRTEAEIPDEPVHRLVFQWAGRMPDAPAVAWDGGRLTYGELAHRAYEMAGRLRASGVGPETVVALQLDRSAELLVSALAVLEAGGAYLPIDPSWPEERQRWILEDSGAVPLSGPGSGAGEAPPDSLAYVIYTSGSTGRPKGTELGHRGLSSFIAWHRRTYLLRPGDRTTLVASPGFDASVWETWAPLTAGAEVHIPPRDVVLSPAALLTWMAERGITVSFLPTPLAEAVLAEKLPEGLRLRALLTGGDRLRRRPAAGLPFELVNHYGPTESTVVATAGRVPSAGERAPDIGLPIANTRVYLLDRHLQPVPFGVAGELCLAGEGLARGYRSRPGLTAERFVPDPFGDGGRLYRTGDLARQLTSGEIEFLGRIDHQVKIRGNRIELGEVEAALSRQPGVESAVVLTFGDRLVAYVMGGDSGLRQALQREFPEAMVPSAFIFLDTLPLTPNGKVDRKALPAPDLEKRETVVAERSPVEELLAGIWAELLGVSQVASHESFFELGGHSLLATRMVSRVRAVLGVEMPLRVLFEEPTLAGFAARVDQQRGIWTSGRTSGPEIPPLVRVPRGGPLPASFSQQRLWFLSKLDPESFAYNLAGAVRLAGALDAGALAGALASIVRRHESLRTVFMEEAGEPWQVIQEAGPLPLPVVDLGGLPEALRDQELRRVALSEVRRPYDLARGPLVRSALVRLGREEHALLLGMHHIVSDGWSMSVFVRELGELYRSPDDLPELSLQYADYAAWQRRWLSGEVLQERIAWWTDRLAGAPPVIELPLDRTRPGVQGHRGRRVSLAIEPEPASRFENLARRLGVTPFMALLSGFAALLSRYGGQDDVVVGTPIANRGRAELEGIVGFFANTLALRVDLAGDPAFGELARRMRETSLGAYAHQDVPFERLVDELRPERSLSHSPVFQVVLALQNLPDAELDLAGLALSPLAIDDGRTQFDLSLVVVPQPRGGGLRLYLDASSDLFDLATADRLLGGFRRLVEGLAEDLPVSALPVLDEAERDQVLVAWNRTAVEIPDEPVHRLVFRWAERTPEAAAIVWDGGRLTYGEMALRARQMAQRLRESGVGPETVVALQLDRSAELLVSALAVLEAGGAYLPVDPSWPEERQRWILEDSRAIPLSGLGFGVGAAHPENLAYVIYTSGSTGR